MLLQTPQGQARWFRSWRYHAKFYLHTWRGTLSYTILFPIFYLCALGVGVGHLVSHHVGLVDGRTYLRFIAPSLLATTAMQMGESESLWPVLAAVKWLRGYHAAVATPLEPEDVLYGKLSWITSRAFCTSIIYMIIIACTGAITSWWGLTMPLIGALVALAFSAPLVAFAAGVETDGSFTALYRFVIVPMFLFSATFYPVSSYPGYLRPIVQFFPLYHGVALVRSAAYGQTTIGPLIGHIAVLLGMSVVGIWWGRRRLRARLVD